MKLVRLFFCPPFFCLLFFAAALRADDEVANYEIHEFSLWGLDPTLEQVNQLQHYPSAMPGVVDTERSRANEQRKLTPLGLIAFHGEPIKDVEVDLRVQSGRFLGHWPPAESKSGRLRWLEMATVPEAAKDALMAAVDDKHWFVTGRQLDALFAQGKARTERFLVYDCELKYEVPLQLTGGPDKYELANRGKSPLLDVLIIAPAGDSGVRIGRLDSLAPANPNPAKPTETKPAEAKPGENKPAESKPADAAAAPATTERKTEEPAQEEAKSEKPAAAPAEPKPAGAAAEAKAKEANKQAEEAKKAAEEGKPAEEKPAEAKTTEAAPAAKTEVKQAAAVPQAAPAAAAAPGAAQPATPGAAQATAAAPAASAPAPLLPGVEVEMSRLLAKDSDELKAVNESLAASLKKVGLTDKETELLLARGISNVFDTKEMLVLFRLPPDVIEERLPLVAYPAPRKTIRTALVLVRNLDPKLKDEVQKLIADLGSEKYSVREAAEKRLLELGRLAVPALKEAAKPANKDLEVVFRAERILLAQNEKLEGT